MPNKETIIQEHDAIRQIIGRPPSWMLRWGIAVIFIGFCVLGIVSFWVSYPDIIEARVLITSENPPLKVVNKVAGKLQKFNLSNDEIIEQGQIIAQIESTAELKDIQKIEAYLHEETNTPPRNDLKLGKIQAVWTSFLNEYDNLKRFLQNDLSNDKINRIRNQIKEIQQLNTALKKQENTLNDQLALAQKAMQRDEGLAREGAASAIEVEQSTERFLSAKRQLEEHQNRAFNNSIRIEELQNQILILQESRVNNSAQLRIEMKSRQNLVQNAIDEWKRTYLLEAPISGKVNVLDNWRNGQFLTAGTELILISSEKASPENVVVRAILPEFNSGKVKRGMDVNIRMDAFPYKEYGVLKGQVAYLSGVAEKATYQVSIDLPNQLTTTYDKQLSFSEEMQGTARIITEKRRLIERLFDQILDVIRNE